MIRSRIAPTPSGYLHVGNALNFVLTWLWVRKEKGVLRLRIDDLDAVRARPGYIEDIFHTLDWLGMDWDEGPQSPDDHRVQYSQLLRQSFYDGFISRLVETGLLFACNCGRKAIRAQNHVCNCRSKNLPFHLPGTALRIYIPPQTRVKITDADGTNTIIELYEAMHDFVIKRSDGIAAYQVASLVDDIDFKVNLIVRGTDLLPSTAAQQFLSNLVDGNNFGAVKFYHHPLLTDEGGNKLSKSAGSKALKPQRDKYNRSEKFFHQVSKLLSWPEPASSLTEMLNFARQGLPVQIPVGTTTKILL